MGAHHSLGRGDADGFEVGTTYAEKAKIAREIAERQIAVAEALPNDHPARDTVLRHALREQRRAARFTRRAKHGTRTRRPTTTATPRPRARPRGHRPARRPGASSRTSSNDPGADRSDPEPPPAARSLLDSLHDETPHLNGSERLAAFLSWPLVVQDLAFDQLAARSRRDWR